MVKVSLLRNLAFVSLAVAAAGCTSTNTAGSGAGGQQPAALPAVVEGVCPRVMLREGTAYYRSYTADGKGDPEKVTYQVSLSDTTRQCRTDGQNLSIDVVAAGKVVVGPAGGPGTVTMPIRVAVVHGDRVLYSELTQYTVDITQINAATQFLFRDDAVVIPASAGAEARIFVGFDEGPPEVAQQ